MRVTIRFLLFFLFLFVNQVGAAQQKGEEFVRELHFVNCDGIEHDTCSIADLKIDIFINKISGKKNCTVIYVCGVCKEKLCLKILQLKSLSEEEVRAEVRRDFLSNHLSVYKRLFGESELQYPDVDWEE